MYLPWHVDLGGLCLYRRYFTRKRFSTASIIMIIWFAFTRLWKEINSTYTWKFIKLNCILDLRKCRERTDQLLKWFASSHLQEYGNKSTLPLYWNVSNWIIDLMECWKSTQVKRCERFVHPDKQHLVSKLSYWLLRQVIEIRPCW